MYFEDMKIGMAVEVGPAVIEKEKMLEFARDYDHIPLHTDEEYAKTTVFGQLIAPGVMSYMALWSKYLEVDFFGKELLAGKSTKIEWHKPVYPGDALYGKVEITTEATGGKTLVVIKDSFANSFVPYLLHDYERIIMLDLRYFNGVILQEIPADAEVLFLYEMTNLLTDTGINKLAR